MLKVFRNIKLKILVRKRKVKDKIIIKKDLYAIRIKSLKEYIIYFLLIALGAALCFITVKNNEEVYTIVGGIGTGVITSTIVTILINMREAKQEKKLKYDLRKTIISGLFEDAITILRELSKEFNYFIISIKNNDSEYHDEKVMENLREYLRKIDLSSLGIIDVSEIDIAYSRSLIPFHEISKTNTPFVHNIMWLINTNNRSISKLIAKFNDFNVTQLYGFEIFNDLDMRKLNFKKDIFELQELYAEKKEYILNYDNSEQEIINVFKYGRLFYKACILCKKIVDEVLNIYCDDNDIYITEDEIYNKINCDVKSEVYERIDNESCIRVSSRFYR